MTVFPIQVVINPAPAIAGARKVKNELRGVKTASIGLQGALTKVFAFAGLGLGLNQLRKFGDSFIELQNRLRVAGFETDQLSGATERLISISNRTRSPLDANARLLGRIGIAAQDLGASQEELFKFVELTGKGLAIQGSSAQEARGALTQLAQALGSGIVRAEEFNSISEGAVPILQAVSAAMGTTVSGLRKLVAAGKVTSKEFFQALLDSGEQLNTLFENVSPTIGQAFIVLENQFIALTGTLETQFGGALSGVAKSILLVANNLNIIIPLLIDLGVAVVGIKLAFFTSTVLGFVAASTSMASALSILGAVFPRVAAGVGLLNTAMSFLARNPIIAIISGLGLAITLMLQFGDAVAVTADGTVTLGSAARALTNAFTFLITNADTLTIVLSGLAAVMATAFLLNRAGAILAMAQAAGQGAITFTAWAAAIARVQLIAFIANPIVQILAIVALFTSAIFNLRTEIETLLPATKPFFEFVDRALDAAVQLWNDLVKAVNAAAEAFGLFSGKADDAASSIRTVADAANVAATASKKAANTSAAAFRGAASSIAADFSSASNSASSSLGTLASNAASSANSISSSMSRAASSIRSVAAAGRGLAGTGTGTGIDTGTSKTANIGTSGALKRIAAAIGGTAGISSAGRTITGGFTVNFGISDRDTFSRQAAEALTAQAIAQTGAAPAGATAGIIQSLAQVTQDLKQAQGLANLSSFDRAKLIQVPGGTGGLGGTSGKSITELLVAQAKLQKSFENAINPPARALNTAAISLSSAAGDLSSVANSPIFLTGNIFEAFRQNVFGFARGGSFEVPGSGGPDSKLVRLALTPGERVKIETPSQQRQAEEGAGTVINQNVTFNVETPDADSFRRSQTQLVGQTLNTLSRVQRRL